MSTRQPLWVVQNNLLNPDHIETKIKFLNCLGINHHEIKVVPFSDEIPEVPEWDEPVIFCGSVKLSLNVWRDKEKRGWRPGVFGDPDKFAFAAAKAGWGEDLLNFDSEVYSLKEFRELTKFEPDQEVFVRPAHDAKEFVGGVMEFKEICKRWDGVVSSSGPLSLNSLIQVSTPKWIEREWRTMVIDGEVVTSSQYMREHCLVLSDEVPREVIEFASRMAKVYAPDRVFTLDIGRLADTNELKVVEPNAWCSSGFYRCDMYKMLDRVNEFLKTNY
jgi:hypothetical protein